MRHIADTDVNLLHPEDHPPPHGVKMLLYMHPHGTLAIGQWQHGGASLWAPMPSVGQDMKARLEAEFEAKKRGVRDAATESL